MKLLQFAVASMVDANTGYGTSHNLHKIDYSAEIQNGRKIRSRSILDSLGLIVNRLTASVDRYKARLQRQRNLNQLYRLNNHLLADIGLTDEDLNAVAAGIATLEQLNAKRQNLRQITNKTIKINQTTSAANQDSFKEAICA